jgi:citronellol/citronellal dehydrogenase
MGTPWDIAEACVYLAGPSGHYITGENLEVSGGGNLWGEVWTTDKPQYFQDATRAIAETYASPKKATDG